MPPEDDGDYASVTDFDELTDEEKEVLEQNARAAYGALEMLLNAVIDHRKQCECPNLLCIGDTAIAMRSLLTRTQEHMVMSVALSFMARAAIAQDMNERFL